MKFVVRTKNPDGWLRVFSSSSAAHVLGTHTHHTKFDAKRTEFDTFDEAMRACNRVFGPVGIEMTVVELQAAHARDEDPPVSESSQVAELITEPEPWGTPWDREEQARNFAAGNGGLDVPGITRATVDRALGPNPHPKPRGRE